MKSTQIGLIASLAHTPACDISAFQHHPGRRHRDPNEELTDGPELVLTTRGGWHLRTSASSGGVTADCLVALDAKQELRIRHDESEPRDAQVMISLKPAFVDALTTTHRGDGGLFDLSHCGMNNRIDAARRMLLDELAHDRLARELAIDNYVSILAVEALRVEHEMKGVHAARLRESRDYLEEHLGEAIDVVALATRVNLSPGHFARLFRQQFGVSPRDYLLSARMRRAAELIDSGVDLQTAAAQVGIHSSSHFRAGFRRYLGMAPSQWKARGRR
ncbi:helix-turn-helix domain-containing protein [Kribbella kalugense]|uniref:Helix-turn-helix protein n=1 Tax=Kribbella kalugense TaxID=2512221 RepID=A0A4R8A249_9ACTN|nr:AraC family transcriptional regulator [Kribbella kalugense]TDW24285.1 helix-turn-helix protein [Kribbella kalugense]